MVISLIAMFGFTLFLLAFSAHWLGLTASSRWGHTRLTALWIGFLLLLLAGVLTQRNFLRRLWQALNHSWLVTSAVDILAGTARALAALPIVRAAGRLVKRWDAWITDQPFSRWIAAYSFRPVQLVCAVLVPVVLLQYIFLASVGYWRDWPVTTDYFRQLGQAFRHGQLALLQKPDPRLAALPDPYDFAQRGGIAYPWDVSYFQGRYYLYWGPTPALIAAVFPLNDAQLACGFVGGTFLLGCSLVLALWRRHYRAIPWGLVLPGLLLAGLANPLPWLLSRPGVYETAIAAGQFFLLAGFLAAFFAIERSRPPAWAIFAAGLFWMLAAAARITLAPAVAFLSALTLYRLWRNSGFHAWPTMLLFGLPLFLGAGGMGLYNLARFGSILEFGHRYQLTGINLHADYSFVFSANYILPNLCNYLGRPYRFLSVFPYIKPVWASARCLVFPAPATYYTEQVTGLLFSLPLGLLAVLPILRVVVSAARGKTARPHSTRPPQSLPVDWEMLALAGAFVLELCTLLPFYASSMRYLADAVPSLVLLCTLGLWQAWLAAGRAGRRLLQLAAFLGSAVSVFSGSLLAVTGYSARLEHLNPVFFDLLTRFFTP